jgi:serine/threonine-protein kinase
MSAAKPLPDPTEIAGRYEIEKRLGAGAFGTVYKAKDKILGRLVAIKTIRLEGLAASDASLEELLRRFRQEAMVAAQLKHPNIVTIYDIGESEGLSYIAMEFIDGVGVERIVAQAGRLSVERAAGLAAQVADALDFAHRNNIVHRDIKPANIMVEAGDRVKVADFGIAKLTNSAEHLTMTGSLLGTPSYMSPEQAKGAPIDGRSDVFSLGCVLYEMLAGQKAFRGESITALIFKIITEEPPDIRLASADVPEEMLQVVSRALAKAPEERFQTGRELADALLAFTRPGTTPTLRQAEVATAAGPRPEAPPTVNVAPTMASRTGGLPVAPPPPSPLPPPLPVAARPSPLPPVRTPPPPDARPSRPQPLVARPAPAPARSGRGLLLGLVLGGGAALAVAVLGALWILSRRSPTDPATASPGPAVSVASTVAPSSAPSPEAKATPGTLPVETASAPPSVRPTTVADSRGGSRTDQPLLPTPAPPPPRRETAAADEGYGFLVQEPPELEGREAGERLADAYRSQQGGSGSRMGATGRFSRRSPIPRDHAPAERPGLVALLNMVRMQAAFNARTSRYGTFTETLPRAPASPNSLTFAGYRFDLVLEADGFRIVGTPLNTGLRPIVGTDAGFVTWAN